MRALVLILFLTLTFSALRLNAELIPIKNLINQPYISNLQISPDGKFVSAVTVKDDTKKFVLIDIETGNMQSIIVLEMWEFVSRYEWMTPNRLLLRLSSTKNIVKDFIIDLTESDGKTKASASYIRLSGYVVNTLKKTPGKVLYAHAMNEFDGYDLFVIEVENLVKGVLTDAQKLKKPIGYVTGYHYDPLTEHLIATLYDDDDKTFTYKFRESDDSKWKTLFIRSKSKFVFTPIALVDSSSFIVLSNQGTDKISVQKFDIASQTLTEVLYEHPLYDLSDAQLNKDRELMSVSFFEHGKLTSEYFTSENKQAALQIALSFPDKQFYISAGLPDKGLYILNTFADDNPGEVYLYHANIGTAELLSAAFPQLSLYHFAKNEVINIGVDHNANIEAFLTMPTKQQSNGVLLVLPHGGPIGVRDLNIFNPDVQYYVNRGFSVLRVNFRGSGGFGLKFQESGLGQFGKQIEQDISAVVTNVTNQHSFDKMCAVGASYGGYSAVMLALKHPDLYDCVVSSFGVFDLPLLFNASNIKITKEYQQGTASQLGEFSEDLFDVSPFYFAEKINFPILLIAGKNDYRAGFEQSNRMYYALNKLGKNVEKMFYDNTGHGHDTWNGDQHELAYIYDYLQRILQLPEPKLSVLSEEEMQGLASEAIILADGFHFDNNIEKDDKRAFQFYRRAAQLGEKRAMFNLGAFYEKAIGTEKDMSKSELWYKKSSELGYASASFQLGKLYYDDVDLSQDYQKSFQFFQLAVEQNHNSNVFPMLARAYCLGQGTEQNTDSCIDQLDFSTLDKRFGADHKFRVYQENRNQQRKILAYLIAQADLLPATRLALKDFMQKEFKLSYFPNAINIIEYGTFITEQKSEKRIGNLVYQVKIDSIESVSQSTQLEAKKDTLFGIKFSPIIESTFFDNKKNAAVFAYLTRIPPNGKTEIKHLSMFVGEDSDFRFLYRLGDKELEPAIWLIEIRSVEGTILFSKEFFIQ